MSKYSITSASKKTQTIITENRVIKSDIPAPGTSEIINSIAKNETHAMQSQLPIVWDKAIDFSVYDHAGNKWIDFTSAIFLANVGHSNEVVLNYMRKTIDGSLISCYSYPNKLRNIYLEKLINFAGHHFNKSYLVSSGTEATEAVLKLIKMHGIISGKKKQCVLCIENNYHGRTLGSQIMTGNPSQKDWIDGTSLEIYHLPFPYPWVLEKLCLTGKEFFKQSMEQLLQKGLNPKTDIAGVLLETFQGWGAIFYPNDYIQEFESFCRRYELILGFDEMQSGFGRTGKNFGFEHYNIQPDVIACGKGMGGGVPLSGVIGNDALLDIPRVGNMSSTHSANPLVCAAGIGVIEEIISRNLVDECKRKGEILNRELKEIKNDFPQLIFDYFSTGLVAAVLIKNPRNHQFDSELASKIVEKCMQLGVLFVHTGRESIKIGPPLTITEDALLEGMEVLRQSLGQFNY